MLLSASVASVPVRTVPVMPGGLSSVDCAEPPCAYKAFRVPGLVALNSTLLAFAEGRKFGCADYSGQIDLVMRRSTDDGASWDVLRTLVDAKAFFATEEKPTLRSPVIRNPTPVHDASSGATFVFFSGPGSSPSDPRKWVWMMRSDNGGRDWGAPRNITSECQYSAGVRWPHATPGGGHGIQLASGKLAVPMYALGNQSDAENGVALCASDDGGDTWGLGAPDHAKQEGWAEPEVTELPPTGDGPRELYMTIRLDRQRSVQHGAGGRYFTTSADGGASWAAAQPVQVPDPQAKGGAMAWGTRGALLMSNAASCNSKRRVNQTLWLSLRGGAPGSWSYRLLLSNTSGYSTLQIGGDGRAANLFESSAACEHVSHTESGPASLSLASVDPQQMIDAGENWREPPATTAYCEAHEMTPNAGTMPVAHAEAAEAPTKVVTCGAGDNCTAVLQAAIDAAVDFTVEGTFEVTPIFLRSSGLTITFAAGSVVRAQAGAFHGATDYLFYADGVEDLTLEGHGARWEMRRADYNSSSYAHSEWRHGLTISSCVRVRVSGLHISDTGGDGVYVYGSRDVELRDVTTDGAYRNGFSLISASNLRVVGCRFLRTAGTPPQAGIDIEPNSCRPNRTCHQDLANVSFEDVEARGNVGTGLSFSLGKLEPNATVDISVRDMLIVGDVAPSPYNIGIYLGGKRELGPPAARGSIELTNVSVSDMAQPGLEVFGKLAGGAIASLRRCRFARVGTAPTLRWGGQNVPLLLHQSAPGAVGGLVLDAEVDDAQARPVLKCDSCSSRGAATNISGLLSVRNPNGGCLVDLGASPVNCSLQLNCSNASRAASPSD
jgi:hypothetical protein